MATFSVQEWRDRADRRFQRSSLKNQAKALKEFRSELRTIRDIETVLAWCKSKKIDVEFKRLPSMYYPENSKIIIASNLSMPARLHVILHECGHHLIGGKEEYERFGRGYSDTRTRSVHHKLDVLEEEFEAWHRGYRLAARLGLKVDKESYDRTRVKHIKTYVTWVSRSLKRRKKKKDAAPLVGRQTTATVGDLASLFNRPRNDLFPGTPAPPVDASPHLP